MFYKIKNYYFPLLINFKMMKDSKMLILTNVFEIGTIIYKQLIFNSV